MPVLLQCPRCGFNYVKPVKEAGQLITCRRCQLVFTAAQDPIASAPPPPAEPPEVFPFSTPTTIPSTPTHFVLESETVHEVEQIEVLDEPGAQPPGSLEIDGAPPAGPEYDDVEVPAPPPQTKQTPTPLPAKAADAGPLPTPASAVDQVEVVVEPVGAPSPPPATFAETFDDHSGRERPPPLPRRDRARSFDIRKRPTAEAGVPVAIWLGLAGGGVAVLLLVLVLVLVLRSGTPARPPVAGGALPPEQFLPPPQEWPLPPDQRGPAPWLPKPRVTAGEIPAAADLEGLIGYWPCDEETAPAAAHPRRPAGEIGRAHV